MAEYTYKDIIIDPTSEEAKNAVGKECYFADSPASCLKAANNSNKAYSGNLMRLDLGDEEQPFYVDELAVSAPSSWTCIIVKKEPPKPKYVPFESIEEFLTAYFKSVENSECIQKSISSTGIWLKHNGAFLLVVEIWDKGVVIGDGKIETMKIWGDKYLTRNFGTDWNELYEKFTFLDGSPCGKLMEESNE